MQPPFVLPDIETLCGCLLTVNPVTLPEGVGCQFGDWTLDRNLYAACNVATTTEAAVDTTVPVGFCTEHSNCDGPTYCNRFQRCIPCTFCNPPPLSPLDLFIHAHVHKYSGIWDLLEYL